MSSIYFIFLSNFVFFSDVSLSTVFFSLECKKKGLNEDSIGLIVASEVLGRILSNVLVENLIIFDKRKLMIALQVGLAICIYNFAFIDFFDSSLVFGLLSAINFIGVGFFMASYAIQMTSAVADYTKDKKEYQKLMMVYGNSRSFGLCFGCCLGSIIYETFEYKLTFVFIASILVISLTLFIFFAYVPKINLEANKVQENSWILYKTCFKNRVFFLKFILIALGRMAYFYFLIDYSINMSTRFGLSASMISLLLGISALISIFISTIYACIKWNGSASLHLQFCIFLTILGVLFLAPCNLLNLPQEIWLTIIGMLCLEIRAGLFSILIIQSFYDTVSTLFPMAQNSQVNRACSNFFILNWTLSFLVGPIYIGYTTFYLSMDYSVLILAAILFMIYLIYFCFGEGYLEVVKYYKGISKKWESEKEIKNQYNGNIEERNNYNDFAVKEENQ